MVIVYDLSPGAAFGLTQRSVYTADGRRRDQRELHQLPHPDTRSRERRESPDGREGGQDGDADADRAFRAGDGEALIGFLPGKNYGTAADEQVLVAAHTDSMSLIQDNGGLGILGVMSYFNQIPRRATGANDRRLLRLPALHAGR